VNYFVYKVKEDSHAHIVEVSTDKEEMLYLRDDYRKQGKDSWVKDENSRIIQ